MARVLVCGGRDYTGRALMSVTFANYLKPGDVVIHGGARGADSMAGELATTHGYDVVVYRADWKTHGRAAGPIRNRRMLEEGKPDYVLAFPGGKGTMNMITQARAANVPVFAIGW